MGLVNSKKFKKTYQVKRYSKGTHVDGEWVGGKESIISIYANIQASFSMKHTMLLPEGDRDKRFIWGSSNDFLYDARSGGNPTSPDIILYQGTEWEVKAVSEYHNFGKHFEFVAVRIKDIQQPRKQGDAECS